MHQLQVPVLEVEESKHRARPCEAQVPVLVVAATVQRKLLSKVLAALLPACKEVAAKPQRQAPPKLVAARVVVGMVSSSSVAVGRKVDTLPLLPHLYPEAQFLQAVVEEREFSLLRPSLGAASEVEGAAILCPPLYHQKASAAARLPLLLELPSPSLEVG